MVTHADKAYDASSYGQSIYESVPRPTTAHAGASSNYEEEYFYELHIHIDKHNQ